MPRCLVLVLFFITISTDAQVHPFAFRKTPYANGYSYRRTVTIDYTKAGSSNSTNFPMLFSGTYSYLATTGNGGNVTNSSGYDIIFTSDSAGSTQLNHEIETYTATTGLVNFWVKVPTVSSSTDTVIYLFYGKSSITSSQENKTGVWSNSYVAVYHTADGTTLSGTDSLNAYNATLTSSPTATTGKIGGGAALDKGSYSGNVYINGADLNSGLTNQGYSAGTIALWVYPLFAYNNGKIDVFWGGTNSDASKDFSAQRYTDGNWYVGWNISGSDNRVSFASSAANLPQNTWSRYVFVWSSGAAAKFYKNGALLSTAGSNTTVGNSGAAFRFGKQGDWDGVGKNNCNCYQDEMSISQTNRSVDWILTEYNNQNSPSTFYSVGNP